MDNVLFMLVSFGLIAIIAANGPREPRPAQPSPAFGVVFVTVAKVLVALVVIGVAVALGLLLIDQHVHSFTN